VKFDISYCGSPDSYIALFPNFAERPPVSGRTRDDISFCDPDATTYLTNPSRRVMPEKYFAFLESRWSGCDISAQTDDTMPDTGGAAVGFR